jgi:thioredoxin:protein disulfide reductase
LRIFRIAGFALIFGLFATLAPGREKILWMNNLDQALAAAKKEHKPIMIDFMASWCAPCQEMEDSTFTNASIVLKAKTFIPVRIDIDKQPKAAKKYNALARAYGGMGIPNMLFMKSDGSPIKHIVGYYDAKRLLAVMNSVLRSLK